MTYQTKYIHVIYGNFFCHAVMANKIIPWIDSFVAVHLFRQNGLLSILDKFKCI